MMKVFVMVVVVVLVVVVVMVVVVVVVVVVMLVRRHPAPSDACAHQHCRRPATVVCCIPVCFVGHCFLHATLARPPQTLSPEARADTQRPSS